MLFNSLSFAVFMTAVFLIYWNIPPRYRYLVLLAANCYFYLGFGVRNFVLLCVVCAATYTGALFMEKCEGGLKKLCFGLPFAVALGLLLVFKYFNFAGQILSDTLGIFGIGFTPAVLKLAAPIGISFYTFKVISYMAEVYRGKLPAQHNFVKYAVYVGFFPQIASGPIERPGHFFERLEHEALSQSDEVSQENCMEKIDEEKSSVAKKSMAAGTEKASNKNGFFKYAGFSYDKASDALKLMGVGFFKKMIVADLLSGYVTKVFSNVGAYDGFALMAAAFLFSIQIYCDFAGYSDIANGAAQLLGYEGARNFEYPYFSASVKEFWGRWHISLSSWFRDYIYIPLGGSRVGKLRYALNIMITFMVSGLWHGANLTFIVWGALHGAVQVLETFAHNAWARLRGRDPKDKAYRKKGAARIVSIVLVFIFATVAWVFFEADSVSDALYVLTNMWHGITSPVSYLKGGLQSLGINSGMMLHLVLVTGMLFVYDLAAYIAMQQGSTIFERFNRLPKVVRWIVYVAVIDLMVIWFMQYGADSSSFVYFEF